MIPENFLYWLAGLICGIGASVISLWWLTREVECKEKETLKND